MILHPFTRAWILLLLTKQAFSNQDTTCSCAAEDPNHSLDANGIVIERCDPNNATYCALHCGDPVSHGGRSSYLSSKCCAHAGKSASILAFEPDDKWVPRLEEFNKCTGANVRLEYLPEGEDGMAEALRRDVGEDESMTLSGEGIFDAYIVQAPW